MEAGSQSPDRRLIQACASTSGAAGHDWGSSLRQASSVRAADDEDEMMMMIEAVLDSEAFIFLVSFLSLLLLKLPSYWEDGEHLLLSSLFACGETRPKVTLCTSQRKGR